MVFPRDRKPKAPTRVAAEPSREVFFREAVVGVADDTGVVGGVPGCPLIRRESTNFPGKTDRWTIWTSLTAHGTNRLGPSCSYLA